MRTDSRKFEQSPPPRKSYRAWGILGTVAATLTLIMIVSFGVLDDFAPPDGATLPEAPFDLSWTASSDATGYTVVLYDADSTAIWKSEPLMVPRVVVPPEVRTEIVPGAVYYWRVISVVGGEGRQSPLYRFTVEP